jgi:hypothetical protein
VDPHHHRHSLGPRAGQEPAAEAAPDNAKTEAPKPKEAPEVPETATDKGKTEG